MGVLEKFEWAFGWGFGWGFGCFLVGFEGEFVGGVKWK